MVTQQLPDLPHLSWDIVLSCWGAVGHFGRDKGFLDATLALWSHTLWQTSLILLKDNVSCIWIQLNLLCTRLYILPNILGTIPSGSLTILRQPKHSPLQCAQNLSKVPVGSVKIRVSSAVEHILKEILLFTVISKHICILEYLNHSFPFLYIYSNFI